MISNLAFTNAINKSMYIKDCILKCEGRLFIIDQFFLCLDMVVHPCFSPGLLYDFKNSCQVLAFVQ